jgi:transposase-like protein
MIEFMVKDGCQPREREVFVSHAKAALTPKARLKLARLVVGDGWSIARAAERFQVAWPTAKRWVERYRQFGPAGMQDRSSRPLRHPTRTPQPMLRKVVHLLWKQRLGPVGIASRLGMPASTVHAVLTLCGLNRLPAVDRATGEPITAPEQGPWPTLGRRRRRTPAGRR